MCHAWTPDMVLLITRETPHEIPLLINIVWVGVLHIVYAYMCST